MWIGAQTRFNGAGSRSARLSVDNWANVSDWS